MAHALGLCLSMAAGSQQANAEQVLAKRLQPALAARAGVQAAWLAKAGMTAPAQAFEGRFGLWSLYFPGDRELLLDGLGERFSLLRTGLKKYPVCACSHAAMDAMRARGRLGLAELADAAVLDPQVADFAQRISLTVDQHNTAELAPATVRLTLRSGARIERTVERMPGSADAPLTLQQRHAKWLDCGALCDPPLSAAQIDALCTRLAALEQVADFSAVA